MRVGKIDYAGRILVAALLLSAAVLLVGSAFSAFGRRDPAGGEPRGELFIGRVEHLLDADGKPMDVVHYSLGGIPYSMVINGEGGADRFILHLEAMK